MDKIVEEKIKRVIMDVLDDEIDEYNAEMITLNDIAEKILKNIADII